MSRAYRRMRTSNTVLDTGEVAALEFGYAILALGDDALLVAGSNELDVEKCRAAWSKHRDQVLSDWRARPDWKGEACWAEREFG